MQSHMDWIRRRAAELSLGSFGGPSLRELLHQPPAAIPNFQERNFLCAAEVRRLLTYRTISAWIKTHPLHRHSDGDAHDKDLIERIVDNCRLLFAILVDAKLEFLTSAILSSGKSDDSLREIDCCVLGLNHDKQRRLTDKCDNFCPVLRKSTHLRLSGRTVLPFTKRKPLDKYGAFGYMFEVKVAEGHLEGYDTVDDFFCTYRQSTC